MFCLLEVVEVIGSPLHLGTLYQQCSPTVSIGFVLFSSAIYGSLSVGCVNCAGLPHRKVNFSVDSSLSFSFLLFLRFFPALFFRNAITVAFPYILVYHSCISLSKYRFVFHAALNFIIAIDCLLDRLDIPRFSPLSSPSYRSSRRNLSVLYEQLRCPYAVGIFPITYHSMSP